MTSHLVKPHRIMDYRTWLLIAVTVWAIVNGVLTGWAFWFASQRPQVELKGLQVDGTTELCPGSTLNYSFVLTVDKAAPVDLYTAVLPSDRVSYVRLQQFKFADETQLQIVRHWILPPSYINPISGGEVPWSPGSYTQRTTAAVVGRSELSEIEVPFSV